MNGENEDAKYQIPPSEEKQNFIKQAYIPIILVAIISLAVGAGGGIFVYQQLETNQTPCEVSVPDQEKQGQGDSSSLELFYYQESQKEAEREGLLHVPKNGIIAYYYLACGFDKYICLWQRADGWENVDVIGDSIDVPVPKGKVLIYDSLQSFYDMAVLTSPIINNTEGSYCFLMQYRALGDILLNIFLTIGDNFVELWNDPIKDLTWQILRVDLEKVSGNFQLFLTASDPQRQNIPEGIIPPRQNVSVSIDYTDLRSSGPCNPSMIVEEVPDVIENGPIPVPDVNSYVTEDMFTGSTMFGIVLISNRWCLFTFSDDRFEFLDFRRLGCGFDVSTCLWKRSGWDISNKSFNTQDALVPKGSFLKYDSYSSNFEAVFLNSPIINNTEGSYCFIMQYQMIGNGDFYILLEDGLYRPLIWRGRFKNLELHILRLDLEAASDFRVGIFHRQLKHQRYAFEHKY